MPVTEEEATARGALKDGYRIRVGLMFADNSVSGRSFMMHDAASTRFMDALPSPQATKIREIIEDAASNELFRVQRARQGARDMATMLSGAASYHNAHLTTDTERAANTQGSAFLMALSDQAKDREQALYGTGGDLNKAAAYAVMQDRDANAWRQPARPADDTRQTNDASTALGDAASEYDRMLERDANAWRR
ncbi:hypothetical protein [Methylobacterium sp. Leaf117]|uniref:hypothetical protein n=1 Tax=Methylobacterium sp. Leaf117 TaxID=1736260 RepID=UPI0012E31875|nr:hypothetical protein [Methylobacterium sp. Leaf117]